MLFSNKIGSAGVLRAALIAFPILILITTIISMIADAEILGNKSTSPFLTYFIYFVFPFISPLSYLAVSFWAAHMIDPIKILNLKLLKRALIFFGFVLPIFSIYTSFYFLPGLIERNPEKVVKYISSSSRTFLYSLALAAICFFAAYSLKNGTLKTSGEQDVFD